MRVRVIAHSWGSGLPDQGLPEKSTIRRVCDRGAIILCKSMEVAGNQRNRLRTPALGRASAYNIGQRETRPTGRTRRKIRSHDAHDGERARSKVARSDPPGWSRPAARVRGSDLGCEGEASAHPAEGSS